MHDELSHKISFAPSGGFFMVKSKVANKKQRIIT